MDVSIDVLVAAVFDQIYKLGWEHRNDAGEWWRDRDELTQERRKRADVTAERDKLASEIQKLRAELLQQKGG